MKHSSSSVLEESQSNESEVKSIVWRKKAIAFYWENEFLILIILAIVLARAYPPLGAKYLHPDITATWIAVCFIFVLAGLGLKTAELSRALRQLKFNAFVQLFNFGAVSALVYGLSRALIATNILSEDLAAGMTICACLPMTINMVMVLTKSAGGDEAAAIFHAAFGNLLGVFLSPLLILGYLGVTADIELYDVFYKLALKVVLPTFIGQVVQKTSPAVVAFTQRHKSAFKLAQQYALVFIVYTVFCKTFQKESESSIGDIFLMILFQFISLVGLKILSWYLLRFLFPNEPRLRVMGLFGCTHKSVATGIPMVNTIYGGHSSVGLYTLPLLIWHPMQLVVGTFLAPRLSRFVETEEERLGLTIEESDDRSDSALTTSNDRNTAAAEADVELSNHPNQ